jgi:hypothetical protein
MGEWPFVSEGQCDRSLARSAWESPPKRAFDVEDLGGHGFLGISSFVSIEIVSHGGHGGHGGFIWVERLEAEERGTGVRVLRGMFILSRRV